MMHEVTHARKWNPLSDWIKFCRVVDIPDVITYANFGEDRLGVYGWRGVKVCTSPMTLIIALTTLSHYRYRASVGYYMQQEGQHLLKEQRVA